MKTQILISLVILGSIFSSYKSEAQKDYIQLVIPEELKDNPKAVAYLEKDAKQLNKVFNTLDDIATEFENLAEFVSKVDTTDTENMEAIAAEAKMRSDKFGNKLVTLQFDIMWYFGKDLFADEDATKGIIEKLTTEEGIAFEKSMKHINIKKEMLKDRGQLFVERLEALDIPSSPK